MQDMLATAMLDICPSQNDSPQNPAGLERMRAKNDCNGSKLMSKALQDLAQLSEKISLF